MKKGNVELAEEAKDCKAELQAAELEIQSLKKSNAGLRGVNTERGKKIKDLEREIHELNFQRQRMEKELSALADNARKAWEEAERLSAIVADYNALPWYKRMFAKVSD